MKRPFARERRGRRGCCEAPRQSKQPLQIGTGLVSSSTMPPTPGPSASLHHTSGAMNLWSTRYRGAGRCTRVASPSVRAGTRTQARSSSARGSRLFCDAAQLKYPSASKRASTSTGFTFSPPWTMSPQHASRDGVTSLPLSSSTGGTRLRSAVLQSIPAQQMHSKSSREGRDRGTATCTAGSPRGFPGGTGQPAR